MDEGGGERHLPGGLKSREEEKTSNRVSQSGTEGGGYGAAHIDIHNMDFDRLVSNWGNYMSAMHFRQVMEEELPYGPGGGRRSGAKK